MSQLPYLALDADDTLWHNEPIYQGTQRKFRDLLFSYHDPEWVEARLNETEIRNLTHFGYGIKGFMLSMIETAIEITEGKIGGKDVQAIIDLGKAMLEHPIEILPGIPETIEAIKDDYELMIITKGSYLALFILIGVICMPGYSQIGDNSLLASSEVQRGNDQHQ